MKHMKRIACILALCALTLGCFPALADGAPASQFGFKGWPCRQKTNCASDTCSLGCAQCSSDRDCPGCALCQAALCTAIPAAPKATPRPAATPAPIVTSAPTKAPAPAPTAAPTKAPSASRGDYTTLSVTAQEQKAWNLLNQDRQRNALSALPLDAELCRLARLKAEDMRDNHYFAHESPTYGNAAAMLRSFGYAFSGVGENIAHHATVEKSEAAFMSSPGHRQNILGSQWTKVGIGVSIDQNGFVYVTQLFAR